MHISIQEAQIAFQVLRIGIIIFDFIGVFLILSIKRYSKYWLWIVPIVLLLINSLGFNIALLFDRLDGVVNPYIYNLWSELIHTQDKLTIAIYVVGILSQHLQSDVVYSEFVKRIIQILKGGDNASSG